MVDVPTDSAVTTNDVIIDSSIESKRESKLDQLSKARETGKQKKRQRDEDISAMKQKLDSISDSLKSTTTKSETIPEIEQVKRQRVTKVVEDVHDTQDESWSTSLIRTTAVVSLGAISWYMQNIRQL
jgi:chromosome segregation ATPase